VSEVAVRAVEKTEASMADEDNDGLDHQFDRIEGRLPRSLGRFIRRLRQPSSRWVRIPLGTVLILGGIFSFLPVLGLWMIPLGLLLIAQDVPVLRHPTMRALAWAEEKWETWTRRRRDRRS
jgi:hypothetical protein